MARKKTFWVKKILWDLVVSYFFVVFFSLVCQSPSRPSKFRHASDCPMHIRVFLTILNHQNKIFLSANPCDPSSQIRNAQLPQRLLELLGALTRFIDLPYLWVREISLLITLKLRLRQVMLRVYIIFDFCSSRVRWPSSKSSKKLKKRKLCLPTFPQDQIQKMSWATFIWLAADIWIIHFIRPPDVWMYLISAVVIRQTPLLLKHTSICRKTISLSPAGFPLKMILFSYCPSLSTPYLTNSSDSSPVKNCWLLELQVLSALTSNSRQNLPNIWLA